MSKRLSILLLVSTLLFSCAPKALREAKEVVAQADSLRAAGQMYTDSARLAESYSILHAWRYVCGDEYAHACYHYGRLLREKENPVEAMQCFINASHARTRDYHILGRVYSNMGSICHLANEFQLSYDMYEHSAEMFMRNGESTAYFYALNDMAFELAEQGKKEETLKILHYLDNLPDGEDVYAFLNLTKSALYKQIGQYDTAIYYAHTARINRMCYVDATLFIAQSYSFLGQKDSAVYYAQIALENTNNLFHRSNALYILTNDETKDKAAIIDVASERADVQKLLEIRQGKLSQAVQLLEQDLHRKPNLAWLYAICATLIVVGLVVFIYVHQKRRQRTLLSQQVNALEEQHEQIVQEHSEYTNKLMAQVEETSTLLSQSPHLSKDLSWNDFEKMCYVADQQLCMIASKLRQKQILNETEVRLCILVLLDLSRKQISDTLPYSLNSVGKLKDHTAKLLGTTGKNLRDFLLYMAVEG